MSESNTTLESESEPQPPAPSGKGWASFGAAALTVLITLIATLVALRFMPSGVATSLVPNAESTTTAMAVTTATETATATVMETVTETPAALGATDSPAPTGAAESTDGADSGNAPVGPNSVYLADLDGTDHDGDIETGPATMKGTRYGHSLWITGLYGGDNQFIEYTIDGTYKTFNTTIGINDESSIDCVLELSVFGNGKLLTKKTARFAKPAPMSADISGQIKLRLMRTYIKGKCGNAVFGDARIA
ncbi:NPCBM/NEW2 domain-containing protein [Streptosporangiaceae bacterium NEAU-GS5]|nr:NPCBM/NEW2 domain-containing protein [Streptosporangiaceae bacterium NEAU-GS5]